MTMRCYAKISPQFWIGETGKALRRAGVDAQTVGLYLLSGPHANMIGLYYLPKLYIAHETGLGMEGASKGLSACVNAGFCAYDETSEIVWVYEMARFQVAEVLSVADKRSAGIQNEYNALPDNPFLSGFYDKYRAAFNMGVRRGIGEPQVRYLQAPSMALPCQEQEQEQEQNMNNPCGLFLASAAGAENLFIGQSKRPICPHKAIIALYHEILPMCPSVRDWTPPRARQLRTRWNEDEKRQNLMYWRKFFDYVRTCDFLVGMAGKTPFLADLEWLTKAANFTRVREGKYEHREVA